MKRLFTLLLACALLGALAAPALADVAYMPRDRFLEKHWQLDTRKLKDAEGNFDESRCTVEAYPLLRVWGENGENLPANALQGIENLYKMLKTFD